VAPLLSGTVVHTPVLSCPVLSCPVLYGTVRYIAHPAGSMSISIHRMVRTAPDQYGLCKAAGVESRRPFKSFTTPHYCERIPAVLMVPV
jgi:hypothetical protein